MSECQACVFQRCLILLRNSIVIFQSSNKRVLIRMFVPTAGCRKRTSSLERAVSSQQERKREPTTSCFLSEQPGGATPERLPCPSLWFAAAPHLYRPANPLLLSHTPTHTSLGLPVAHLHALANRLSAWACPSRPSRLRKAELS